MIGGDDKLLLRSWWYGGSQCCQTGGLSAGKIGPQNGFTAALLWHKRVLGSPRVAQLLERAIGLLELRLSKSINFWLNPLV